MGLFSKLKNTLFEEEEVIVDSTPEKVVIKEEAPKKEEPKKTAETNTKETDLFRADNSFDFPDFDEEEFMTSYERMKTTPKVEEKKTETQERYERPIRHDTSSQRTTTTSRATSTSRPSSKDNISIIRRDTKEDKPLTKKAFRPSPVISPVYGVLDKDYTKDDFIKAKESNKIKSSREVDKAIKKAFGTMDDDITKTINEPVKKFYREDSKSIDDLLKDSIDDTIDLDIDETNEFTDTMKVINKREELEQKQEVLEDTIVKPKKDDDTLESDLFDLIDSMYDNKEDE